MQPFAERFYKSKTWQRCRDAFAKKQIYCQRCMAKGIIRPGEIVHHVIEINPDNINDPAISLNWDNLELLCRECHAEAHGARISRYKIDELGKVSIK